MGVKTHSIKVSAGLELAGERDLQIAADVFLPEGATPTLAWVCLPGGGMKRQYFDLPIDESFSFARQMAQRGFAVITLDHLGMGESSRPAEAYALTPEVVAEASANATAEILRRLREGRLASGVAAMPQLRSIGVGHSMGAMIALVQQAQAAQHEGIVLLGFSTRGLPEYMPSSAKAMSHAELRAQAPQWAHKMFGGQAYPVIKPSPQSGAIFGGKGADPRSSEAIKAVADGLLPVPAFVSMIPDNVRAEAQRIRVPVYLGIGEKDMVGAPHEAPASFSASHDVSLYVMPGAGHSHFLFPIRLELFDRLADWAQSRFKTS